MSFRIYFDENVYPLVAVLLRQDGYDVLTTQEAGRASLRKPDEDQLEFAVSQQRVLFTHDARTIPPLIDAWAEADRRHWGVIL